MDDITSGMNQGNAAITIGSVFKKLPNVLKEHQPEPPTRCDYWAPRNNRVLQQISISLIPLSALFFERTIVWGNHGTRCPSDYGWHTSRWTTGACKILLQKLVNIVQRYLGCLSKHARNTESIILCVLKEAKNKLVKILRILMSMSRKLVLWYL